MKKRKLLALLSVLMLAAMLLSSCGGAKKISKVSSLEKVLNSEYDDSTDVLLGGKALTELNHFAVAEQNDEFILFVGASEQGLPIYKVFSFRSKAVVQTFANTETTVYTVSLTNVPAFTATSTEGGKTTYLAYDAAGNSLSSSKRAIDAPTIFADMVLYGNVLYTIENNGALTKAEELPEALEMRMPTDYTDEYYYFYGANYILVYDRAFQPVTAWYAPASAEDFNPSFLNNGNVLVQYKQVLDPNAEEYQIYDTDEDGTVIAKYNLVTKLITPKNGKVKDVDMDYVIHFVRSATSLHRHMDEDNSPLSDKVENVAYICPIVDRQVDDSDAARDIVLMDNNGKLGKSIKIADGQLAMLPELVGENTYLVHTLYGRALVNAKGKTLQLINNDAMRLVGGYIIGENAVYNLNMEVVYDLVANDAIVLGTVGDTVLIKKGEDFSLAYNVIALCGGEVEMICRYEANTDTTRFVLIDGGSCYALYNTASGEYTYYNAAGESLITTKVLLTVVAESYENGTVVLMGMYGDVPVYSSLTE